MTRLRELSLKNRFLLLTAIVAVTIAALQARYRLTEDRSPAFALVGLLVGVALGFGCWALARSLILRPLASFTRAAQRIAAGDFSARMDFGTGPFELRVLARTLDGMAESLEQREARLRQIEETRAQTNLQLQESEQLYRTLVETSPDGIALLSLNGTFLLCNQQAAAMTGVGSADRLIGTRVSDCIAPDDRPALARNLKSVIDGEAKRSQAEYNAVDRDGTVSPLEISASVVRDGAGKPKSFIAIMRDTSERRRLQAQLLQAQKMEAIGRLAGGVAHDFNNLLTAVVGYSDLLLKDPRMPPELTGDLRGIRNAGERATTLTRQLLAFGRRQILQPKIVDLNTVVSDTNQMLRRLIGSDIDLVLSLDPQLKRTKADPGQIEQVLFNLTVNSRDAMPGGGKIRIETANAFVNREFARSRPPVQAGPYVKLTVRDTGCGMDQQTLSHIFEPFFTTKEPGKGTGLGLSTVYGIVKQSGGYVWASSTPGHGATFEVYLPAFEGFEESVESGPAGSVQDRGTETILLVEDEEDVRVIIAKSLRDKGYTVLEAGDGQAAIQIFSCAGATVAGAVVDLVIPHVGGYEVARRLRELDHRVRILYISGYSDEAVSQQGTLAPGTAFLQKPFRPEHLSQRIRQLLDEPQSRKAGQAQ
jgi:two-component system, cell cycle sensor histidine kinase and response regulator CckA